MSVGVVVDVGDGRAGLGRVDVRRVRGLAESNRRVGGDALGGRRGAEGGGAGQGPRPGAGGGAGRSQRTGGCQRAVSHHVLLLWSFVLIWGGGEDVNWVNSNSEVDTTKLVFYALYKINCMLHRVVDY